MAENGILRLVIANAVNPRISPLGAYLCFGFLHRNLFEGGFMRGRGLKNFSWWLVIFQLKFFN